MNDDFAAAAESFDKMEALIAHADAAWHDEVDAHRAAVDDLLTSVGLDPADRDHRRAFAMGLCIAGIPIVTANFATVMAAALRPPVRS